MAPLQVKILPITDDQISYAHEVEQQLLAKDVRVEVDDRSATLGAKIRDAEMSKVPYMLIVGEREVKASEVNVRARGEKKQQAVSAEKFVEQIVQEIEEKR